MANRWDRERALDVLRELDSARLAEGEMRPFSKPVLYELSAQSPDIPSPATINKYIGGVDNLNAALGRVTTKVALAWTDEQWAENAQWAKHVLENEGVNRVTPTHIARLASAGLMPNMKLISDHWINIHNYRQKMGIETRSIYYEAKNWDKEQYFANGREYAEYLGRDFGFPLMPRQADLRPGSKGNRIPTRGQINAACGSLEQYQEGIGFVNPYVGRKWTDQQWIDNFNWLKDVADAQRWKITSITKLLHIAGALHVGPTEDMAEERWGTLLGYAKHVGFDTIYAKNRLSNEGVTRKVLQTISTNKRPLRIRDIREHLELSEATLIYRFGGINRINLQHGWVVDTSKWDRDMCTWWGVTRFMPTTENRLPEPRDLDEWASLQRGPYRVTILRLYGKSFPRYTADLERAQAWMTNQLDRLARPLDTSQPGMNRAVLRLALTRNHELFHPDRELSPSELSIFYRLKDSGINMQDIAVFMDKGILLDKPDQGLRALADILATGNILTSNSLKKLEPYIIGLAPPEVEMNWSDFIARYRKKS